MSLDRAKEYWSQGKANAGIGQLPAAITINPDCARTHYELGNIYYNHRDYQLAIEYYSKAILKKGDLSQQELRMLYLYCGDIHSRLMLDNGDNIALARSHSKKAFEYYTQMIRFDSNDQEAYYKRANIGTRLKDVIFDYSKAIDLENIECEESIKMKRHASAALISVLKDFSKEYIFRVIVEIEDEPFRIHLLKKCLNRKDPELGEKFSPVFMASLSSNLKNIQGYLNNLEEEKRMKQHNDFLERARNLLDQMKSYAPTDFLEMSRKVVEKTRVEDREACINHLEEQLISYKDNPMLEEKTDLLESISAGIKRLRLFESCKKLADPYEEKNNAERSVYKLAQQTSEMESERLEKLDRQIREDLNKEIQKNSHALLEKADSLVKKYNSRRVCVGLPADDTYIVATGQQIIDLKKSEKNKVFLDEINRINKELAVQVFSMSYSFLCKEIESFLDKRKPSYNKNQDREQYEKYGEEYNNLVKHFNDNSQDFSLKELEKLEEQCDAQIAALEVFQAAQSEAVTQEASEAEKEQVKLKEQAAAVNEIVCGKILEDIAAKKAWEAEHAATSSGWKPGLFDATTPVSVELQAIRLKPSSSPSKFSPNFNKHSH